MKIPNPLEMFRRWRAHRMLEFWRKRGCMVVLRQGAMQTEDELVALLALTQRSGFLRDGRTHHAAGRHTERKIKTRATRAVVALAGSAIVEPDQVPPKGTIGAIVELTQRMAEPAKGLLL